MGEFERPTSEEEFKINFGQINPLMNETEAYMESSRCLFCFDAPCQKACPTSIDVPLFIRQISSGDYTGSARTIYTANYFGAACGKVCPTEVLCEGACVFTEQNVKPIEIGRLQYYVSQKAIDNNKKLFEPSNSIGKSIAIIGAGPAGISCACELRLLGYEVDIFEAKASPSGLTMHGVAPYKITNDEVLKEMEYLRQQFGYTIHFNSAIVSAQDLQKLEGEYEAIFIGIGLGTTASLKLKGEDLKNCYGATELIEDLRLNHHQVAIGRKVIVLGAGNTAMDAASESARMGADKVILAYRGSKDSIRAYEFEFDLAKSVGVNSLFNVMPKEIIGEDKVEGVKFVRTENHNGQLEEIAGSEFIEACDMVIRATGQSKQVRFLNQIEGLQLDSNNRISINPQTYQTGNSKYFAAGDAVNGGKEVVNAAADGKQAASGIHLYLS